MNQNLYAQSNSDIIKSLGLRFKEYRRRLGLSQKDIAEQTGLSIFTISTFESGKATGITLISFIKLLRAIEELEQTEAILPELPQSAAELYRIQQRQSKR